MWRSSLTAGNLGTLHTINMHLEGVLNAPQVVTNLVSLGALDADGLGYVGEGGMISMFGGESCTSSKAFLFPRTYATDVPRNPGWILQ